MNLLLVTDDPSLLQGRKGRLWQTLQAFSPEWDRIDVLCPHSTHARTMQTYFGNVHVHPNPRDTRSQSRWIRQQGAKLHGLFHHAVLTVHAAPPFHDARAALRLARDTGMPCVLDVRRLPGVPHAVTWRAAFDRLRSRICLPRLARRAAATRVASKSAAEILLRWGAPKTRLHVIPSVLLDPDAFNRLPDPPPVQYDAVCCGPMVPERRLDTVLRAAASLKRARLLLLGDGPDRPRLERLAAQLSITHRVEFRTQPAAQAELLQAIRSARVYVMLAAEGGDQQTSIDALAAGMPVIVTPVGILSDVIEDGVNGLFTTGEPNALADTLQRLLDDPELRERLGQEARGVLDRFERDRLTTMVAHFLRSCA